MLVCKALIVKLQAIDAFTTRAVPSGEITSLSHELWDYTMKGAPLEVQRLPLLPNTLLSSAQRSEILGGLRSICEQFELNPASLLPVYRDVEIRSSQSHI